MLKFNRDEALGVAYCVFAVAVLVGVGYGWINNIVELAHSSFSPVTGMLVLRCIGIFVPPIGVIMGYL